MARVAFIAHCLLNQNAKVEGGAHRAGMWEPVIGLLREHDYVIRQMPCPELAFAGARRFWGVREQFDTPLYRRHCRRLAKLVAAVMAQHVAASEQGVRAVRVNFVARLDNAVLKRIGTQFPGFSVVMAVQIETPFNLSFATAIIDLMRSRHHGAPFPDETYRALFAPFV